MMQHVLLSSCTSSTEHHRRRRYNELNVQGNYTPFFHHLEYFIAQEPSCPMKGGRGEGGGLCKNFVFYLNRPQDCSYILLGKMYLLVICESLPVFWATKDLLRSLIILCCLGTHLVCFGNREGHLLGLLFQTIYSY